MTPSWDSLKAIFTLADVTARQQAETEALLLRLHKISRVYEQTLASLPEYVERGVNQALPNAAETAAKRIATRWTDANIHAENASAAYAKAKRAAPWLIFGSAAMAFIIVGAVATVIALKVLPSADQIASMRIDEQQMRATIAALEAKGGRTPVAYCDDLKGVKHLCVRIDQNKKSSVTGYQIVHGL